MRNLWIPCFVFAVLGSSSASAITDYKGWDGISMFGPFGCGDVPTGTMGQVITIPKGQHTLNEFSFWWRNFLNFAFHPMVVRGEVYAWDGQKATGDSLYESRRKILFRDNAFHRVNYYPALNVTPGAQYVIFATIDKDVEKCRDAQLAWGAVHKGVYKNGRLVYLSGYEDSQWTTQPWQLNRYDLVFKARTAP